jgi:hypothetical protein
MPKYPACGNAPAMSRRNLLTALPAFAAAPSIAGASSPPSPQERLDELAHEFLEIAQALAPDGYEGASIQIDNSGASRCWAITATRWETEILPNGKPFQVVRSMKTINPHSLTWF